jgi:nucleotide-binding universal stress UspA family protein
MYQTILLPLDGSPVAEAILPQVVKLVSALKSRLILVRVSRSYTLPGLDPSGAQIEAVQQAQSYLEDIQKRLADQGIESEIHVPYGDPAWKILEICKRHDLDLIAMSTHGRSGLGRWVMGSVAEKVVRHSDKPVLLMRSPERGDESES